MENANNNFLIEKSIIIKVTPSKIWNALTKGELTKKYMFGYEVKSDWKVGSSIVWILKKDGKDYSRRGKVLQAEQNKILKISDFNPNAGEEDIEPNYAIVKYELFPLKGNQTKLQITDNCATNEKKYKDSQKFWKDVLPKLKKVLEE